MLAMLLIAIILCAIIFGLSKNKTRSCFDAKELYFVYTDKNTKQAALEVYVDKIKNLGGAGKIIFHSGQYYLVSSVYFSEEQANEVKGNILPHFPNSGVLKVSLPKVKGSIKKEIKKDEQNLRFFEFFDSVTDKYQGYMISYMSGTLSQSDLSLNILKDKLAVQDMIKSYNKNSGLSESFYNYLNMMNLYYDNFFDKFFESQKKESLISEFAVSFSELKLEYAWFFVKNVKKMQKIFAQFK